MILPNVQESEEKMPENKSDVKEKNKTLELEHEDPKNDIVLPNVQESEEKMPENKSDVREKNKTLELEHEDPKNDVLPNSQKSKEKIQDVDDILKGELAKMTIEGQQLQGMNTGRNIFEAIKKTEER